MVSGGTFYTIRDDQSRDTTDFLETIDNYDKKIKEAEEKRRRKEEGKAGEDREAMFREANFICLGDSRPARPTIIPKTQFT